MADTHVQVGHTATIEARFYADGVLADDGTPTIGITKADGTILVAAGAATSSGGTGIRQFALPAQSEVNLLKATWTGSTQTVVTWVEIIGDILYTLAALRGVKVGAGFPFTVADFPNQMVLDRRVEVTQDFEARTGYSFVPRFAREALDGNGRSDLVLRQLRASKLLSVTIDGTAQPTSSFTLAPSGVLTWKSGGWFSMLQRQNVTVEYVRGWDRTPPVIASAALARTAMLLLPSLAGSTASSWTTPDGTTYSYDAAGQVTQAGTIRHYGVPGIDSVLNSPTYSALGLAVA